MTEAYCNWSFDFVGYDKTCRICWKCWTAVKSMFLHLLRRLPEWEEKYAYTDQSIGTSATILSVMSTEDEYVIGDPSTYDGMVIGAFPEAAGMSVFRSLLMRMVFNLLLNSTIIWEN